jgi:hypothetical protein
MKLEFRWSFIYEEQHHPGEFDFQKIEKETKDFINSLEKDWKPIEKEVLNYIEEITKLKFKSDKINCYVIHTSTKLPISDPLTIAISFKTGEETFTLEKKRFLDMMIHELIHNILIENEEETDNYFKELFSGMYDENWNVSIHVLVHAIHKKIFDKFFDKERIEEELETSSYFPDYKKAWEIVEKEGEDKIIEKFRSSISKL